MGGIGPVESWDIVADGGRGEMGSRAGGPRPGLLLTPSLLTAGEEGQSAHRRLEESLDALPRIFGPGSMASTAF